MEKIFFNLGDEGEFVVHLNKDEHWKGGDVYPIHRWTRPGTNEKGWSYQAQKDGGGLETNDGARCFFGFLFSWRGVWEGRIYFKDEEYWSEELEVIALLWSKIQDFLKERIRVQYPGDYCDNVQSSVQ